MKLYTYKLGKRILPLGFILCFVFIILHEQSLQFSNYPGDSKSLSNARTEAGAMKDGRNNTEKDETIQRWASVQKRFIERKFRVQTQCRGRPKQSKPLNIAGQPSTYTEFYLYEDANVAFCSPPKSGSTTVDNFIIRDVLESNITVNVTQKLSKIHYQHRLKLSNFTQFNEISGSVKFITVRSPLERVLSCWYDKFSGLKEKESNAVNRNWGKVIKSHFPELEVTSLKGQEMKIPAYTVKNGTQPTLEQFFRFIASKSDAKYLNNLTKEQWDMPRELGHWAPISAQCYPCEVDYDYIILTETLSEDLQHVLQVANPSMKMHEVEKKNAAAQKSKSIETDLLLELPLPLIKQVLEIYKLDYDIFGYDYSEQWLQIVSMKDSVKKK